MPETRPHLVALDPDSKHDDYVDPPGWGFSILWKVAVAIVLIGAFATIVVQGRQEADRLRAEAAALRGELQQARGKVEAYEGRIDRARDEASALAEDIQTRLRRIGSVLKGDE